MGVLFLYRYIFSFKLGYQKKSRTPKSTAVGIIE